MQHVHRVIQPDRVHRPKGIAVESFHNLEHSCATETSQWLGIRMFAATLSEKERSLESVYLQAVGGVE